MIEIHELLYRWQKGLSLSAVARGLGQSRQTVRKYLLRAQAHGATRDGDMSQREAVVAQMNAHREAGASPEAASRRTLASFDDQIRAWLEEPDMTMKQVWRLLQERDVRLSYPSVKRYIRGKFASLEPRSTVRLETPPGQQAQVDFGQAVVRVGEERVTRWMFIMTLSYSRHRFVRFVKRQDLPTWLDCHVRGFEFFGGVPRTVLLDNLKAGVVRPDLYDPRINRAYGELEHHYGFVADPAKVATPEHKGKVERQNPVVRQQLVAGRTYRDDADLNERALTWCREQVGREPHGTTGEAPVTRFERDERPALLLLPESPFERPTWGEVTVHTDHHLIFERSYYSVPTRYIGRTVWVRATPRLVQVYCDDVLVKTHPRATTRGTWVTDRRDYPEAAQIFFESDPAYCLGQAAELGPHVGTLVGEILAGSSIRGLRKAQAVLRLADKYGKEKVDEASAVLLAHGTTEMERLRRILEKCLSPAPAETPLPAPLTAQAQMFLHPAESFDACITAEVSQ
ncbi:IS21 family transposase [Myxococcota bacterium]|nr:IS21 family transposase [Myxococcota bacterium]